MSTQEEILVNMSRQLGEIQGILKAGMEAQEKTNSSLFELSKGHEYRLQNLECLKNKVIGALIIASCGGSGIAVIGIKLLGVV